MAAAPLTPEEFAAALDALGGFERRPLMAVAVSGGPDSMALILLADRWAQGRGGTAWGLTVDHRLRPESGDEARRVAAWLATRGIPHAVLAWTGDKPASGIQEAAREARYALLAAWCRAQGCLHLLTAHHREDQAETHLIRLAAGSGPDGLAGMSAIREMHGCRLLRPLLATPRARLAALLAAEGQPYLCDPSNRDPRFARARLRNGDMPEPAGPIAAARTYGERRRGRERELAAFLARTVALHPAGFATLDLARLSDAPRDLAERALGRLAATLGRARYPARRKRLAALYDALAAARGRTLGGCRFVPWRGRILVLREVAAAAPPLRLDAGTQALWDDRFAVSMPREAATAATVGYLGRVGVVELRRLAGRLAANDLPRLVYPVLPAVWDAAGLAAVPHLFYRRPGLAIVPGIAWQPPNALAPAGFTVV